MYSEIEERRDQENEGQTEDCSKIVHWCKGGRVHRIDKKQGGYMCEMTGFVLCSAPYLREGGGGGEPNTRFEPATGAPSNNERHWW